MMAPSSLPQGWEAAVDPQTGRTYYYNRSTGETAWQAPGIVVASQPPAPNDNATNPTAQKRSSLIQLARNVTYKLQQHHKSLPAVELSGLTVGQVADLQRASSSNDYYEPIRPHELSHDPLALEPGRIESRLQSLYEQLGRIGVSSISP